MQSTLAQGLAAFDFRTLAAYHPQAALAVACGVPLRPNVRNLSVQFSSSAAVGTRLPASFAEVIGTYSIFAGCDTTIDPTNAFPGNPLKYLNDTLQAYTSGITFTLECRGQDDYTPMPDEVPLQSVPRILSGAAGIWVLDNPDNVKATFTLQVLPNAAAGSTGFPITAWVNFMFLTMGSACRPFLEYDAPQARKILKDEHGFMV